MLGATAFTPEQLEIALNWIDYELDGRPYGVDVLIPQKYVGSDEGDLPVGKLEELLPEGHREFLDGILDRYHVPDMPADGEGPARGDGEVSIAGPGVHRLLDVAPRPPDPAGGERSRPAAPRPGGARS